MKERTTAKFYTITMAMMLWISAFVLVLNTRTINAAGEPIQSRSLSYQEGSFVEREQNDGQFSISDTKSVTLTGDTFVDGPFVEDTHYTTANVPDGLTLSVTRDNDTQVTLRLSGKATAHTTQENVRNLTITFLDAAFTGGDAASVENSTKSDMEIDFWDLPELQYNGAFSESVANDGSVISMVIINLLRGRFSEGTFTQGTHYTIDNVPAGMTLSLGKTSLTQVILSLTGNAIDHNNADDISNLTITFLDAAFQAVPASEVINSTKNDIRINFNNPILSYEMGNFTEALANDGSISTTKTVTLTGDTFAEGPFQEGTHFTTAYVPTGLNLVVTRNSNTQVTLSLTGKAIFHANTYNINTLTIAFQDAAFANSDAAEVTNATKNNMGIYYYDPPELTYLGGDFTEAAENDGSITATKTINLTGDTFTAGPFKLGTHYTVANVPEGLTLKVINISSQAMLYLTGKAVNHNYADRVSDMTITFLDAAFTTFPASGVKYSTNTFAINFNNPVLSYASGSFTESAANDGSIDTTKTVTLAGDKFVAGPFIEGTHYLSFNVPLGLTLTVTRDSDTQVTLSLTGNATAHENANDVTNLEISFQNAAFVGNNSGIIVTSIKEGMVIDFLNAPLIIYSSGTFTEAAENDGSGTDSEGSQPVRNYLCSRTVCTGYPLYDSQCTCRNEPDCDKER